MIIAGADVVQTAEGRVAAPQWPGRAIPPGSKNRARSRGFPRNLGGPVASRQLRRGHPGDQLQARGRRTRRPRERTQGTTWYRQAKATKRGGTGDGESERLDSTGDAGEPTRGTPPREGGRRAMKPLEGKMPGTPSPEPISTRQQRIAELARQIAAGGVHDARPPHRHRLAEGGVSAHAQGRGRGCGRTDGGRTTRRPGGQPPVAAGPRQVRPYRAPPVRRVHIPKGTGGDQTHRHPDVRGQGPPACGRDGPGAGLRAGLLDCSYGFRPGRWRSRRTGRPLASG